ncbi:MAG: hypothetical protein A2X13_03850 [Bacteroidetes bacterium GWC2_33_15]|nr:MAG: hypothetical protein A2X10_02390 [Bacteroidetes bacterium GWA2_33_15]OFX49657.1 MAG: hypothetical protein A2X13_03850 [Bacteroidetes bacterium GWC2_33_15]OFX65953.1 MAG: hypothetical protein A2X15_10985 [Bacteroidetes bacterium GWB2_32_14]OFX68286.1 MAG: hypothetical protein A2X14_07910 [Bacteroidetes bacterium GWD2_33_33]HAN18069.1 hypothetical protein [Bacteroidales bacterium]
MAKEYHIINLAYLKEISNGDNKLITDLIELFFEQIPEYQLKMNEYFEQHDWNNLGRIAHKAKSAILMAGMEELALDLKKLEQNTKDGENIGNYKEIIVKFVNVSNAAIKELQEVKKQYNK